MRKLYTAREEQSLRRYAPSEEDRAVLTGEKWNGGYRWFKSANVLCLEHYRPMKSEPVSKVKAS